MRTRNVILVLAVLFVGFLFGRVIPGGAGRRARLPAGPPGTIGPRSRPASAALFRLSSQLS